MKTLLWVVITCTTFATTNITAQNFWKRHINGVGDITERTVDMPPFTGVSNGYACKVHLTQGSTQEVQLRGQANILDNLILKVKEGVLVIRYDRMVRRSKPVDIYITIPSLHLAKLSGSGNFNTLTKFSKLSDLTIGVSGSGNMTLDVETTEIDGKISGSGNVRLIGNANMLDFGISGSGNLNAERLMVEECMIKVSGSGDAVVHANKYLTANVSGSGNVKNLGSDARIESKVSGSGSVKSL